jgi:hypothetical protein
LRPTRQWALWAQFTAGLLLAGEQQLTWVEADGDRSFRASYLALGCGTRARMYCEVLR